MRIAITLLAATLAVGSTACKKKSGGGEAVAKLNEFTEKMCACKNADCAKQVSDDFAKWGASQPKGDKPAEVSPDEAKAMADATKKYSDCMQTAMAGGGGGGSGSGGAGSGSDIAGSGSGGAGSGSDSGSGSQAMGSGSGAGSGSGPGEDTPKLHMAGNCPSTVLGAKTTAEIKGKTVVVHVTSDDKDAIVAIQKRAEELVKEKSDDKSAGAPHDQKGTHGGGAGICPVYYGEGGTAKVAKEAKGAAITITPKDKPEDLKKVIDERITKAEAWVKANVKPGDKGNQGGVGGGQGGDGANHSGKGDGKGKERKGGDGKGGGKGTGGGGGQGTGGGGGSGSSK
jgi:hypothetical protein